MAKDLMPGATYRPVSWADSSRELSRGGAKPNKFIMHVADSEASGPSLEQYFERTRSAASHFYVEYDGDIYQFQPISARSGADYGSQVTVSVETQGRGAGKWTSAQLNSLAAIAVWLRAEWGIPLTNLKTSARSARGIGTHRLGCDGNFAASGIQAGRLQRSPRGEKLSGVQGKICPGYDRQAQWHEVTRRAKKLAQGMDLPAAGNSGKPSGPSLLSVDGLWGEGVTLAMQKILDTAYKDGEVSRQNEHWDALNSGRAYAGLTSGWQWVDWSNVGKGSQLIRGMQADLKKKGFNPGSIDGLIGPKFFKALQRWLKDEGKYTGPIDGTINAPSSTVVALQKWVNAERKAAWSKKQAKQKQAKK